MALHDEWSFCRDCQLAQDRLQVVVGETWPEKRLEEVDLLVIGEAPGSVENESGRPFVGPSGMVLRDEYLTPAGVRSAYITNLVGCHPPGNRDPENEEIVACAGRIQRVVETVRPKAVLAVGKIAEAVLSTTLYGDVVAALPKCGVVHPSFFLRKGYPGNPAVQKSLGAQVHRIQRFLTKQKIPMSRVTVVPDCEHELVEVGTWRRGEETAVMRACAKCSLLEETPANPFPTERLKRAPRGKGGTVEDLL